MISIEESETDDVNIKKSKKKWSPVQNGILKSFTHIWGTHGNHIGWNTSEQVIYDFRKLFPEAPIQTIKNKMSIEKTEYENEGANYLNKKPDIAALIQQMKEDINGENDQNVEEKTNAGRSFMLNPIYYAEVEKRVLVCKGMPGFGVNTVRAAASLTFNEHYSSKIYFNFIFKLKFIFIYLKIKILHRFIGK